MTKEWTLSSARSLFLRVLEEEGSVFPPFTPSSSLPPLLFESTPFLYLIRILRGNNSQTKYSKIEQLG